MNLLDLGDDIIVNILLHLEPFELTGLQTVNQYFNNLIPSHYVVKRLFRKYNFPMVSSISDHYWTNFRENWKLYFYQNYSVAHSWMECATKAFELNSLVMVKSVCAKACKVEMVKHLIDFLSASVLNGNYDIYEYLTNYFPDHPKINPNILLKLIYGQSSENSKLKPFLIKAACNQSIKAGQSKILIHILNYYDGDHRYFPHKYKLLLTKEIIANIDDLDIISLICSKYPCPLLGILKIHKNNYPIFEKILSETILTIVKTFGDLYEFLEFALETENLWIYDLFVGKLIEYFNKDVDLNKLSDKLSQEPSNIFAGYFSDDQERSIKNRMMNRFSECISESIKSDKLLLGEAVGGIISYCYIKNKELAKWTLEILMPYDKYFPKNILTYISNISLVKLFLSNCSCISDLIIPRNMTQENLDYIEFRYKEFGYKGTVSKTEYTVPDIVLNTYALLRCTKSIYENFYIVPVAQVPPAESDIFLNNFRDDKIPCASQKSLITYISIPFCKVNYDSRIIKGVGRNGGNKFLLYNSHLVNVKGCPRGLSESRETAINLLQKQLKKPSITKTAKIIIPKFNKRMNLIHNLRNDNKRNFRR